MGIAVKDKIVRAQTSQNINVCKCVIFKEYNFILYYCNPINNILYNIKVLKNDLRIYFLQKIKIYFNFNLIFVIVSSIKYKKC